MGALHTDSRDFVVASGGTTQSVVLEDWDALGLLVPSLTSTTLKIQVSQDGTNFFDVYDGTQTQVLTWAAGTGSKAISSVDMAHVMGFKYLQVVCGTAQGAAKTFTLTFKAPRRKIC